MRVRSLSVLTAPLLAAALVACTSPEPTPVPGQETPTGTAAAAGGTFTALLDQIPDTAANGQGDFTVVYGDLDRATADAGLTRPADAADPDAVINWLLPITGVPRDSDFAVHLAESLLPTSLSKVDEIEEELGWSVVDVQQYVEIQAPPQRFLLAATGDLGADLDAAQGPAVDGVWGAEGEDFRVSLEDATAARRMGENIRTGNKDGLLAVSLATPPLTQWLSGGATLADDPALTPVTRALDAAGVYTAMVATGTDFSLIAALGPSGTPDMIKALGDVDLPLPFITAAAGLTVTEGTPTGVVVLSFPTEQAAADSLEPFRTGMTEGTSVVDRRPIADRFQLIDAKVDANLIVATVSFDGSGPSALFDALQRRDLPFVHG